MPGTAKDRVPIMTDDSLPTDSGAPGNGRHSHPTPLGVSPDEGGGPPNVAVYAPEVVGLNIHFESSDGVWHIVPLPDFTDGVHHGLVRGLEPGCRYAFWPQGQELPAAAGQGQLLLDPYGRAIQAAPAEPAGMRTPPAEAAPADAPTQPADASSGPACFSAVVGSGFDWGNSAKPRTPMRDSVIYEAHVKGLTMLHPDLPPELRGTYAGLAHPAVIAHLTGLGITAVELLPVHFSVDEPHLRELGLRNYWGYNTLGYFAPQPGYATAAARQAGPKAVQDEFKTMVRLLHEAGLEVILDVVYNHTAEGGADRPALSWRGLAEREYYRHDDDGRYVDTTGCGNSLDFSHPRVVQLVLDSLRYWAEEVQIDGFRFDLAVTLARGDDNRFNPLHPFLAAVAADPALAGAKLLAEPWDVGADGWQTGAFPPGWTDWNDRFRDTVKDFWLGDRASLHNGGEAGSVARLAGSLAGSADVFAASGRSPLASLNFVTAHDGFTLADLTAYNVKHNEANGEANRDGHGDNRSWNHGTEGATDDGVLLAARDQSARNLLATLLLSLGVPMLTAGDELGRSQQGNNNAYCQDNKIAWLDWSASPRAARMLATTRSLLKIRREFLSHQPHNYPAREESSYLLWFNACGQPMTQDQWSSERVVQLLLGSPTGVLDGLLVINGTGTDVEITLPSAAALRDFGLAEADNVRFNRRFSTAAHRSRGGGIVSGGGTDTVEANTITVYRGRE